MNAPVQTDTPHVFCLPDVFRARGAGGGVHLVENHGRLRPERMKIRFSTHAVSVVLDGSKRLSEGDAVATLGAGQALIYAQGGAFVTEDSRDFHSLITFIEAGELSRFLSRHAPDLRAPKSAAARRHRVLPPAPRVADLARFWADHLRAHGPLSPAMRSLAGEQILRAVLEDHGAEVLSVLLAPQTQPDDARVSRVLEAQWEEGLTVEEMAFLAGMSPSTFKRRVRGLYGMSPKAWVDERRLGFAWHLLTVNGARPSEVARRLGYASASAFSAAFRRHYGVAPSDAGQGGGGD